ncbi:cytochrome P450 [Croceicoccus bisphenolivorans]|uniref:cytochrome P450 n=1 Tax=Croceicoccus bisphenolivorans TaxID=1783232 RepID=UPI001C12C52E|nr:cytochrome P450 [Croceicoccus bisphenolivorans]
MNEVVNLSSLRALRPVWQEHANELVEHAVARGTIDGVDDIAQAFPLRIFPATIGLPAGGEDHLLRYASVAFNAFGPRNHIFENTANAAGPAAEWVAMACERANLNSSGWGAGVYAAADEGRCTESEAGRLVRSLLTAGLDTTINGIGNMLYAFSQNPGQWDKLREEPRLLKRVFDESLRWDSTAQTFFRTASRDVRVAGVDIPEGSKVLLFLGAANRDPRKWSDAETFDITRSASGHVGFGFGIHQCLGQMMARQEAEMVLNALLPRVRRIEPAGDPGRVLNNTLHALGSLPITFVPD